MQRLDGIAFLSFCRWPYRLLGLLLSEGPTQPNEGQKLPSHQYLQVVDTCHIVTECGIHWQLEVSLDRQNERLKGSLIVQVHECRSNGSFQTWPLHPSPILTKLSNATMSLTIVQVTSHGTRTC